jgi:hypothetical protein
MLHELFLNAVLIIVALFALDRREARWTPRAARRQQSHLRAVPHSVRVPPASEHRKAS